MLVIGVNDKVSHYRHLGLLDVKLTEFLDNWHMKVTRLSRVHTSYLYPQKTHLALISVKRLSRPKCRNADARITLLKNANDPILKRSRDLPACFRVPQPTAPPRNPATGVAKQNPGQQMAEKVDKMMEFMLEQRVEGRRACDLLEKNKFSSKQCVSKWIK